METLRLIPGVKEALRLLKEHGYFLILFTNQSGIGRGYFSLAHFWRFNHKLEELLGGKFDDILFCPHKPEERCTCRKPSPYLLHLALNKYPIDPRVSWVIGDSRRDIEAGIRAGLNTVLVLTGKTGREDYLKWSLKPTIVADNLLSAVRKIIGRGKR